MRTLVDTTFTGKDISSAVSVYEYTVTVDATLRFQVRVAAVAGGGVYTAYLTLNQGDAGTDDIIEPKSTITLAAGETAAWLVTTSVDAKKDDVVNVFLLGQAGDTDESGVIRIFSDLGAAVAASSSGYSYASLDEFTAFASVRGTTASTDAGDDLVIEDIIETASRYIDNITGRRFWTTTATSDDETRYYTPEDRSLVFIDDLVSITTLKVDYYGLRDYADTLATTDYDLEPYNATIKGWPYTWLGLNPLTTEYYPTVRKGVQIIGKFGFPTVPTDIKEACLGIAFNIYQSRIGQSTTGQIQITGAGVVIRPRDVPVWAVEDLNKYKRLI